MAATYPTQAADIVIRVNVQIDVAGQPSAKVTLREQPGGSYAVVLEAGNTVTLGVTQAQAWRALKSATVTVPRQESVAIEFSALGDALTVSLGGQKVIEVRDSTHRCGSPGLAVANGTTVFKDIEVKLLKRTEAEIAYVKSKTPGTKIQPAVSGKREYALAFDGRQSYVETPVKYDGSHPLTIEAWVASLRTYSGSSEA